ncbi:Detected protein of confused Function [Hibiscus syriacus]|uniref:Detected protein of confused Function n=1 Tax=Hibiscus syriacus TaxID=106335 RepID=A0A6A3AK13_HIBSY|nr:Detected protein of confused Function [Hibiscus syriacus]
MFEPFIEDDVPFDEYCQYKEKDGTWAGHMELQAASFNMSPHWYIKNFDDRATRMVHLSYHDEEHYNSLERTGSIKLVMAGSGCESAEKVEEVLLQVDGDVDSAIEFLAAEQGAEGGAAVNDSHTCNANDSYGNDENGDNTRKKL